MDGISLDDDVNEISQANEALRDTRNLNVDVMEALRLLAERDKLKFEKNKIRIDAYPFNPVWKLFISLGLGLMSLTSLWVSLTYNSITLSWSGLSPFATLYLIGIFFIFVGIRGWNKQHNEKKRIYHMLFNIKKEEE